jgi:hypothetical protein
LLWFYLSVWHHHVLVSVVVLTLQMELMLTVSVGDCIAFQQICPITLTTCKSATTKRLCCICNIYYYLLLFMKNEDTPSRQSKDTMAKRKQTKRHTMNYKTIHIQLNIWGESSSCSTNGARHVILVANPVICHKWGKDRNISSNSSGFTSHLNISYFFYPTVDIKKNS